MGNWFLFDERPWGSSRLVFLNKISNNLMRCHVWQKRKAFLLRRVLHVGATVFSQQYRVWKRKFWSNNIFKLVNRTYDSRFVCHNQTASSSVSIWEFLGKFLWFPNPDSREKSVEKSETLLKSESAKTISIWTAKQKIGPSRKLLSRVCVTGFGLVNGFIYHLYIRVVTTSNYPLNSPKANYKVSTSM
jgi:hypothetical protein